MAGTARRLDVVLEYQEDEGWAVVAVLIDYYGKQRRRTLGRYATKDAAGERLKELYDVLARKD